MKSYSKNYDSSIEYVCFFCEGCKSEHCVPVTIPNENEHKWGFNGNHTNPTITPSIDNHYPKEAYEEHPGLPAFKCHINITDGKIIFHGDCTHEMAGQTKELPDKY